MRLAALELAQDLEQAATLYLIRLPPTGAVEGQVFLLQQAQHNMLRKQVALGVVAQVVVAQLTKEPLVIHHQPARHKVIAVAMEKVLEI